MAEPATATLITGDGDPEEVLLDRVFFALSDPVRRAILERLDAEALLVSELAAPFAISLQAVSRHIQVLVRAGLVQQERTGRISRCRLEAGPILSAALWINRYSKYWQGQFDLLAAALAPAAHTPRAPAQPQTGGCTMSESHPIVGHEAWIAARKQLLAREKEFTRARDALSQARRDLPWERVTKDYAFEGPDGRETLPGLFAGRSQLVVYHFMFAPEQETPCKSCSFWADNFDRIVVHLAQRDVTMVAISRAPLAKLAAFKRRMGWGFKWVSSGGGDFNYDFQVSFVPGAEGATYNYHPKTNAMADLPGISVFHKDEAGGVFHTYSCYARGLDMMNVAYHYLDLVPKGRDERGPHAMAWVRYHDSY